MNAETELRPVIWLGDTDKEIRNFPDDVKQQIGYELHLIQGGEMPKSAKLFKGVGSGVIEIAIKYDTDAYRCVQAVQLGNDIYVLHAFKKKSSKGIETPKKDVDIIKQRYKDAQELARNE